jgi:hypothetical protein
VAGLAVGFVTLLVVGYPVVAVGLVAYTSFTGCFISCGEPQPGRGLLWSALAAVLLAVPVAAGLAVAGVRSRAAWLCSLGAVVAAVAGWALLAALA